MFIGIGGEDGAGRSAPWGGRGRSTGGRGPGPFAGRTVHLASLDQVLSIFPALTQAAADREDPVAAHG
ncbi:hypothetical protein [Amycolatopsis pigmentata]|uniref:Uncharacterized protein n=1 Tax=Amycolatopsis pigmentata TaxID=450801 RepID=A0ABW5G987_9PSEU